MRFSPYAIVLLALALLSAPRVGHAAEDYANCSGTIASLPTVISTPGTWCVEQNLSTAVTSGSAIDIQADNVTIDCNDFKLDGSGAGSGTTASGISTSGGLNVTVRRCDVRGFSAGLYLTGSGDTVEDNRLEGNRCYGMYIAADGSIVQRNRVFNTGGAVPGCHTYAITVVGTVDVLDNTVDGVAPAAGSNGFAYGLYTGSASGGNVVGNRIRGLVKDGTGLAIGIESDNRASVRDNDLIGNGSAGSYGMSCFNTPGRARDNVISGFAISNSGCTLSVGNVIKP